MEGGREGGKRSKQIDASSAVRHQLPSTDRRQAGRRAVGSLFFGPRALHECPAARPGPYARGRAEPFAINRLECGHVRAACNIRPGVAASLSPPRVVGKKKRGRSGPGAATFRPPVICVRVSLTAVARSQSI